MLIMMSKIKQDKKREKQKSKTIITMNIKFYVFESKKEKF